MEADFDAIIVGGGPSGSTAAILLAQAGWSVAVIERQSFPRRKVCGECIAATNLPLLHALGIGDSFDRIAGPEIREVALFVGEETLQAPLPPFEAPFAWGRALGREHLDTLLLERASAVGATVLQPRTVKRIEREGLRHLCHTVGADHRPLTLSAPVLIAAHGSWEPDPAADARPDVHRDSDLFAFKANYRHAALPRGLLPVLAFPGGYGGIVVGDHDVTTLAFCIRRDALREVRGTNAARKAAISALAHVRQHCRGVREAIDGAQIEGSWLGVGPLRTGIRKPFRDDGVFAIGNVAGEAHPILGEGMSMAIQSAWLLCDRLIARRHELVEGRGKTDAGSDYARAWRRAFSGRIRLAAAFAHLAMRPGASRGLLPVLQRWPALLSLGAKAGGKVRAVVAPARAYADIPSGLPG